MGHVMVNGLSGLLTARKVVKTRFANEDVPPKLLGIIYDIPTDGLFQVYWPNGNLRYEWYYKDGKRVDGVSKGWYSNSKLKQTITWKNGKRNGKWIQWWENGQKVCEWTFKDGKEIGLTRWNDNGQKKEYIYKDGKIV